MIYVSDSENSLAVNQVLDSTSSGPELKPEISTAMNSKELKTRGKKKDLSGTSSKKLQPAQTETKLDETLEIVQTKKNRRTKSRERNKIYFSRYIFFVLKLVHSDIGITRDAMSIMNSFMNDMFERIATEAALVTKISRGKGKSALLGPKAIETATKLVVPGGLGVHAVSEAKRAMLSYYNSFGNTVPKRTG